MKNLIGRENYYYYYYYYYYYHVKFNVCLVTKPLGVFSSEREWLNASLLFLRMNYICKCIIKQLLNSVFASYHELSKPRVCVICLSLRLRQITQTSVLITHDIMSSHCVIVRVRVVLKRTVVGDWRFDNLSGSHLQSQVNSVCQSMVL